ncbi:unnamed protein product [Toxocara canis]|uniref:Transposase n=1 Tax=Toxocara canis TaxID=6265 RepID=A0A183V6K7_TOXCA|nr:unnamed protein product [Toxocara canis]
MHLIIRLPQTIPPSVTGKKDNGAGRLELLVDPKWDLVDPTPDIRALFLRFNERRLL